MILAEFASQNFEHEVIKTILNGYDADVRPVRHPSDTVTVTMGLAIHSFGLYYTILFKGSILMTK